MSPLFCRFELVNDRIARAANLLAQVNDLYSSVYIIIWQCQYFHFVFIIYIWQRSCSSIVHLQVHLCPFQETFALLLQVLWDFLHLVIIVWHVILRTTLTLHSYLISSGLLKKYRTLDLTNLRYLAIVVEDEEAYDIARIVKLLQWLSQIRVKRICLYDRAGK